MKGADFLRAMKWRGQHDCILWPLIGDRRSGYGKCRYNGEYGGAYRASYLMHVGPIPDGMLIRHTCDVRKCVNPNHLIVGTRADNRADCVARGRQARGATNAATVLTREQVREIFLSAEPGRTLAKRYGVDVTNIWLIRTGRSRRAETSDLPRRASVDLHRAKITPDAARMIFVSRAKLASLAERYGLTQSTVSQIRLGRTWAKATSGFASLLT